MHIETNLCPEVGYFRDLYSEVGHRLTGTQIVEVQHHTPLACSVLMYNSNPQQSIVEQHT